MVSSCLAEKEVNFVVKTSSHMDKLRLVFSLVPRSISHRLQQLTGKTAGELLRLLCELTIGFRKGSIERSYRQLAERLGKSTETIARAAKLLLRNGDVIVEGRPGRSYRWTVLLESADILSDPAGICSVRSSPEEASPATTPAPSPIDIGPEPVELEKPLEVKEEAPLATEIVSSEIAPDAAEREVTGSDTLLKRLTNIGMSRRVAKELLEQHEHGMIVAAIENAKGRSDIKNRAGYVLREVRDGGYEEMRELAMDETPPRDTRATDSDAPRVYSSAELTRAEMMAMEAEKAAKQQEFAQTLRDLQERCARLSEDLRGQLKECCHRHLAQLVPKTSRREMWMENPVYKKLAFKDVMERFFGLVDQGIGPEEALLQVAQ